MPSPLLIRRAIRSRIKSRLIEVHTDIPWIYREDVQRDDPRMTAPHVIIDIVPARSRLAATGSPRLFRTRGALAFRIATPMTDGAGPNEAIAEQIAPHFNALLDAEVDPPILYYVPLWAPTEVPDEQWFVGKLTVDWRADTSET